MNEKVDIVFYELVEVMIEMKVIKLTESVIKRYIFLFEYSSFHLKNDDDEKHKT